MIPRTPIILPRGAGEGDRPKGGGRGALLASLLIQVKRKKGPHHHAEPVIGPATSGRTRWHGPPPPQSGEDESQRARFISETQASSVGQLGNRDMVVGERP